MQTNESGMANLHQEYYNECTDQYIQLTRSWRTTISVTIFGVVLIAGLMLFFGFPVTNPLPPSHITATPECEGVKVNWRYPLYPKYNKIDHYRIEKTYDNIKETEQVSGNETSYLIKDVHPATNYSLQMVTHIKKLRGTLQAFESIESEPVQFKTLDPLPPTDIKASLHNTGIKINWRLPSCPVVDKIDYFRLEKTYKNKTETNRIHAKEHYYLFDNPFPATTYTFRMITCTKNQGEKLGVDSNGSEIFTFNTPDPLPPNNIKVTANIDELTVTWSSPLFPHVDKIDHYRIEKTYGKKKSTDDVKGTLTTHSVRDVLPATTYHFQMFTCSKDPNGTSLPIESEGSKTVSSPILDPLPPTNLKVSSETNGLILTWRHPVYPKDDGIDHYRIEKTCKHITEKKIVSGTMKIHNYMDVDLLEVYSFKMFTCTTKSETSSKAVDSIESETVEYMPAGIYVLSSKRHLPVVTGNCKLVVAIDIGTTSSVYAYSFSSAPSDIQLNKPWDSGTRGLCSPKTPTCILLSKDFKPINIGYEAQKEYSDHIYDKEDDDYFFVDKFKMKLYEAQKITEKMTIKDIKGHSVPAIQVFSSMIRLMKKRAEKEIKTFYSIPINHTTQWVLTIPAVWTDRAETFMRTCTERAGIPHEQLMIVVGSESASVYIHHLIKEHKLQKSVTQLPKKYLVIDLGGGTDDITAHRISKNGNLKETSKPSGSANGGKQVDKQILSCLEEIAGENVIKIFKTKGSFLELLDGFENINNLLSISSQKTKIAFKFPLNLLNELCREHRGKKFQELLQDSKYYNKLVLVNDRMRIDRELIVTFISKVASDIVEDIKYALQKAKTVEIKTFIVVGGFSNSYVIRDSLKKEFPDVEIIYPPFDVDLAVVKGSVLYGHNPNYIKPCSKRANLK